jgi:hypothetical protein
MIEIVTVVTESNRYATTFRSTDVTDYFGVSVTAVVRRCREMKRAAIIADCGPK